MAPAESARAPRRAPEPWNDPQAVPYVRIENVVKRFGDVTAVDDVSLNIYRGELFALLGGSGSGKTTLLRMLAGFEMPTSGSIWIDGIDMAGVAPYDRPVNMMFQSYALFPHMNVEQNVAFGLKQEGLPKAEIAERVAAILDMDDGLADRLQEIEVPTLVIVGNQDILTPRGDSEHIAEMIPTAELVVVSGAAHGIMVEHATTFNTALLDFLRRAERSFRAATIEGVTELSA